MAGGRLLAAGLLSSWSWPARACPSLPTQRPGATERVSVASAQDPGDDGDVGARELGAEITGASVAYRPEQEDLLLRIDLDSLPGLAPGSYLAGPCLGASAGGGAPAVLYRWAFTVEETAYEVRALRASATTNPPTADPYVGLYRCAATCTELTRLFRGIGTTGAEVRVSVPLEAVGAGDGAALTGLGAATPLGEVSLDASSLAAVEYRVWARACLGEVCGTRSMAVTR